MKKFAYRKKIQNKKLVRLITKLMHKYRIYPDIRYHNNTKALLMNWKYYTLKFNNEVDNYIFKILGNENLSEIFYTDLFDLLNNELEYFYNDLVGFPDYHIKHKIYTTGRSSGQIYVDIKIDSETSYKIKQIGTEEGIKYSNRDTLEEVYYNCLMLKRIHKLTKNFILYYFNNHKIVEKTKIIEKKYVDFDRMGD